MVWCDFFLCKRMIMCIISVYLYTYILCVCTLKKQGSWDLIRNNLCFVAHPVFTYLPGEGTGNPLQYPCLENPMDRGAWWARVHGVTESDMIEWLTHTPFSAYRGEVLCPSESSAGTCHFLDHFQSSETLGLSLSVAQTHFQLRS